MESKDILPVLALQQIPKIGPKSIEKILSIFTSFEPEGPQDLLERLEEAHKADKKIKIPDIQTVQECWNKSKKILETSQKNDIKIISRKSPQYPRYLLKIPDPPALLHVKGNINAISQENMIAIIGTREPTSYGSDAARKLGELFAREGFVVVSGLAAGIDSSAHKGALDADGLTVAVLAHGLQTIYPEKNRKLANRIIEKNGALVSEYYWGKPGFRNSFVERDRIQSGLSLGVFVIETDIRGGTMHTVKFCKDQNRILIVLKHPADFSGHPKTRGNIKLISDGTADIKFETDDDLDLIKLKLNNVRKKKNIPVKSIQTTLYPD